MQHSAFTPSRRLASHCAELRIKSAASEADPAHHLAELGLLLAEKVKTSLARLPGTCAREVRSLGVAPMDGSALIAQAGPLAANRLVALDQTPHSLLISADARAVMIHLDRSFGGRGDGEDALPQAFPTSAYLLADQLEQALGDSFAEALAEFAPSAPALGGHTRHARLAMLSPFGPAQSLAVLSLEIAEEASPRWQARFAVPTAVLPELFARTAAHTGAAGERLPHDPAKPAGPANPLAAPFADIPLPLEARLVDMAIPLSRLAHLAPGTVLPITVARQVPLRIGDRIIARGTIGAMDDAVALQIIDLAP